MIERILARKVLPELFWHNCQPVYVWSWDGQTWLGRTRFSVWKPMPADKSGETWDQAWALYQTSWSEADPKSQKVRPGQIQRRIRRVLRRAFRGLRRIENNP